MLGAWTLADLPQLSGGLPAPPVPGVVLRGRPVLAGSKVRYAGEPIAVVAAEDAYSAADAAAATEVALDPLPAVVDVEAAAADDAPMLHEELGTNVAAHLQRGFGDAGRLSDEAPMRVHGNFRLGQVAGGYLEPRAVTAWYEHPGGAPTIWTSTQWTFGVREALRQLLGIEARVLAPHVGGAFGAKGMPYPEEVVAMAVSRQMRRPVRWVSTRSEDMAATAHAHGTAIELELAADPDGRIRALRGSIQHSLGAYAATAPLQVDNIVPHLINAYRLPALEVELDLVYTTSTPAGFVRGGGRPIGNFGIERMLDRLARVLCLDPVEIRRRNLVRPDEMPYDTGYPSPGGRIVYDSGDYPRLLQMATNAIGYTQVRERQRQSRGEPDPVGVGVACLVESTGIGLPEEARIHIDPNGEVRVWVGTTPQGQGHETVAAQVAAERLGWPSRRIKVIAGDSLAVSHSGVTAGSRGAVEMGNAVALAASAAREELQARASAQLQAEPADLELGPGGGTVSSGAHRRLPLRALVGERGLEVVRTYDPEQRRIYASGCHAVVVRLDPETGGVSLERSAIAHDAGRMINPRLVEGQTQGGYVHGLGYALLEQIPYGDDGSLAPGSFLDYGMPGAPECAVAPELLHSEMPSTANPEGFRGAGEGGTIPVPAAVLGAVEDCARQLGCDVRLKRLPLTPNVLYESLAESRGLPRGEAGRKAKR